LQGRQVRSALNALPARARRLRDILTVLAVSDMRMRYGRGGFRAVKWVLDPFAALGVYLLLVALLFDRSGTAAGLSLACAIVPFQLIMMTVINALRAVEARESIIVNLAFPRILIPLSAVVTESVAFAASLVMLPIMMIVYGIAPTPAALWLPVALAATVAFSVALAYPTSLIGIWYPEIVPFAVSLVRALFFVAPGLVALDQVAGTTRDLLPLNPLTGLFESFRDALLYGQAPAAWELLVPAAATLLVLGVSLPAYRRDQAHLAKLVG
jgi:ABC-type polysaccharide/polyol phosphate export permease